MLERMPDLHLQVVIEQNYLVAGIRGQVPIIKVRLLHYFLSMLIFRL